MSGGIKVILSGNSGIQATVQRKQVVPSLQVVWDGSTDDDKNTFVDANDTEILTYMAQTWYVRPSGGSYGDEDGTSYVNAWDGFSNIDWNDIDPGDTLIIAGTHTEQLIIGASGNVTAQITISEGVIDATGIGIGILVSSKDYITFNNVTCNNANTSNIDFLGTSSNIITNNCIFRDSGNQCIQHQDTVQVTHNNPTCTGATDDGISGHDASTIVINGGTFTGNSEGIAVIGTVTLTLNGPTTFGTNSLNDLTLRNGGIGTINNVVFDGQVECDGIGTGTFTTCTLPDLIVEAAHQIFLVSCIIGTLEDGTVSTAKTTATDCLFTGNIKISGEVDLRRCRISKIAEGDGAYLLRHCLIDGIGTGNHTVQNAGVWDISYCVIVSSTSNKLAFWIETGGTITDFHNNTITAVTIGRGFYNQTAASYQLKNTIITGVQVVDFSDNESYDYCCFYDNLDAPGGTPNTNQITTDPKLVDSANLDFTLDVGSSCIGTGLDLGTEELGIDTANWGNGVDELPIVTTKLQTNGAWDIGAYIN